MPDSKQLLYKNVPHPHKPRNVNELHAREKADASFNQRVALRMTQLFSSMLTFWAILAWLIGWIFINSLPLAWDRLPWPLMLTLASVPQLPLMVVIMVGQGLLGRKQELQSEEQFNTTQKIFHDVEQLMQHLGVQDGELIKQTQLLNALATTILKAAERKDANP